MLLFLSYSDNERVIDFLDRRATGLLTTLTTDTRFDRVTDEACLKGFLRGTKSDDNVWGVPDAEDYFRDDDGEDEREMQRELCKISLVVKHFTGSNVRYNFQNILKTNRYYHTFDHAMGSPLYESFSTSTNATLRDGVIVEMDLLGMKNKSKSDFVTQYKKTLLDHVLTSGKISEQFGGFLFSSVYIN